MTKREIQVAIKYIQIRRHNNYAMQAALHGHKIKLKHTAPEKHTEVFSPEEDMVAEKAMQRALSRAKLSYKPKK